MRSVWPRSRAVFLSWSSSWSSKTVLLTSPKIIIFYRPTILYYCHCWCHSSYYAVCNLLASYKPVIIYPFIPEHGYWDCNCVWDIVVSHCWIHNYAKCNMYIRYSVSWIFVNKVGILLNAAVLVRWPRLAVALKRNALVWCLSVCLSRWAHTESDLPGGVTDVVSVYWPSCTMFLWTVSLVFTING